MKGSFFHVFKKKGKLQTNKTSSSALHWGRQAEELADNHRMLINQASIMITCRNLGRLLSFRRT
jgi:hypothetical protein